MPATTASLVFDIAGSSQGLSSLTSNALLLLLLRWALLILEGLSLRHPTLRGQGYQSRQPPSNPATGAYKQGAPVPLSLVVNHVPLPPSLPPLTLSRPQARAGATRWGVALRLKSFIVTIKDQASKCVLH